MALNRDQILEKIDLPREEVKVPEWGGTVFIAAMSGTARDAWEQAVVAAQRKENGRNMIDNARAMLVAYTAVDEHGNRLFTAEDIARLGLTQAAALERLSKVAARLNRLTERDLEDAKGN